MKVRASVQNGFGIFRHFFIQNIKRFIKSGLDRVGRTNAYASAAADAFILVNRSLCPRI
jgi:hypothetical protein